MATSTDERQYGRPPAADGTVRVSTNGYSYTKSEGKWRLTHHLIAEAKLGRALAPGERVEFKDKDRENLSPENILVRVKGEGSITRRIAVIDDRIRELQAERDLLVAELRGETP
jgi:hypothetical protein